MVPVGGRRMGGSEMVVVVVVVANGWRWVRCDRGMMVRCGGGQQWVGDGRLLRDNGWWRRSA